MNAKKPQPPPPKKIRVMVVGDHPWAQSLGYIESLPDGKFVIHSVLGSDMIKVKLDCGHECFAGKENLTVMDRPTSPPSPRKKRMSW